MRLAGIDCGTNSIRLLVADVADGRLVDVHREMRVVRLGAGVDRTGVLDPAAIERTRLALVDYAGVVAEHGAERVRMVATSATRDATNRAEFVSMVRAVLGAEPEVITGGEEARLSFNGAVSALGDASGSLVVADVGGGSTELVRGGDRPLQAHSMDVGCVRMTERHLRDDLPTAVQVAAVVQDVRVAVAAARHEVDLDGDFRLVGLAGTVTTLTALALGLERYDPDAIHGASVTVAEVDEVTERLLRMTRDECAALPVMHPGRVDVICGGALVVRTLLSELGAGKMIASEHDILDGIVLGLAG